MNITIKHCKDKTFEDDLENFIKKIEKENTMINAYDFFQYLLKRLPELTDHISKGCAIYETKKYIELNKEK